ncbi:hypothetical protein [Mesorhizobium sp. M0006]|uniref:hypothetical protein n=1 Tax=Mesorhizobium sp. M0006 TaxID=2956838 RepID=UPI0033364A3F
MGAGASILGSLFGGDEETTSHVDYKRMVRDAEAAGFNPLTAIRNGGSAGFTSTHTPGNGLSAALSTAGNFLMNFDPMADTKREKEFALLDAQVRNLNAESGFYNTRATASGPVKARPGTAGLTGGALPPVASWFDPPAPIAGKEPLPVWVPGVDRDGKKMWIPNPDGPDIEQLGFGLVSRAQSGWEAFGRAAVGLWNGEGIKRTKVPAPASTNMPAGNAWQLPPLAAPTSWGNTKSGWN